MSAMSYAQAKGRAINGTSTARATLHHNACEKTPLTEEEERIAKRKWNTIQRTMPWMAEFLKAMAKDESFDGRRALLEADVHVHELSEGTNQGLR